MEFSGRLHSCKYKALGSISSTQKKLLTHPELEPSCTIDRGAGEWESNLVNMPTFNF